MYWKLLSEFALINDDYNVLLLHHPKCGVRISIKFEEVLPLSALVKYATNHIDKDCERFE